MIKVPVLLDSGAEITLVDSEFAKQLKLPITGTRMLSINGFDTNDSPVAKYSICTLEFWDAKGSCHKMNAIKHDNIGQSVHTADLSDEDFAFMRKRRFEPAISGFGDSISPAIIFGCDFVWNLLKGESVQLPTGLFAINSTLGYLLSGKAQVKGRKDQEELKVLTLKVNTARISATIDRGGQKTRSHKRRKKRIDQGHTSTSSTTRPNTSVTSVSLICSGEQSLQDSKHDEHEIISTSADLVHESSARATSFDTEQAQLGKSAHNGVNLHLFTDFAQWQSAGCGNIQRTVRYANYHFNSILCACFLLFISTIQRILSNIYPIGGVGSIIHYTRSFITRFYSDHGHHCYAIVPWPEGHEILRGSNRLIMGHTLDNTRLSTMESLVLTVGNTIFQEQQAVGIQIFHSKRKVQLNSKSMRSRASKRGNTHFRRGQYMTP
jgi:hypothetical protein